jgi:hypothetical protein
MMNVKSLVFREDPSHEGGFLGALEFAGIGGLKLDTKLTQVHAQKIAQIVMDAHKENNNNTAQSLRDFVIKDGIGTSGGNAIAGARDPFPF